MSNKYYRDSQGRFTHDPAKRSTLALNELYRAFDFFNETFADGKLPKVVITVQESGRKNALGWFAHKSWIDNICNDHACEINLSAEYIGTDANSTLCTLLHEMAHLYNASHGVKDCSSGQYHNKHFKIAAEKFGLVVTRIGNRGYAQTDLGEPALDAIKQLDIDEKMLCSLKRKRQVSTRERRYMSLIVSHELEDMINNVLSDINLSQKEFVEQAILNEIRNIKAKSVV